MKNILIFNTQAFGDALLGTHLAKLQKPEDNVFFAIRDTSTLTTAEKDKDGLIQMLDILKLQHCIEGVGIVQNNKFIGYQCKPPEKFDKIITQNEWFSDLGIASSMLISYYEEQGYKKFPTKVETKFNVGTKKEKKSTLTIATAGPLDWERKWGYFPYKLIDILKNNNITIVFLGKDVCDNSYLKSLQELNNCHLYIGPMGSISHISAGLNVDTINICSVFPPHYDSPEYYHSGYHKSIIARSSDHCGNYKCITKKFYDKEKPGWGNPQVKYDFWTRTCDFMESGNSCVSNIKEEDIINEFGTWYENSRI